MDTFKDTYTQIDKAITHSPILNARELIKLLLGDHEGGQVGGVVRKRKTTTKMIAR